MILRGEVLSPEIYGRLRGGVRAAMAAASRVRRIGVCEGVYLYFESRQSLWFHLHELLHATSWDERAIREELAQINQLIPAECGLVATAATEHDADPGGPKLISGGWSLRLCGRSIKGRDLPLRGDAGSRSGIRHLFFGIEPVEAMLLKTPGINVDVCLEQCGSARCVALDEVSREAIASDLGVRFKVEAT